MSGVNQKDYLENPKVIDHYYARRSRDFGIHTCTNTCGTCREEIGWATSEVWFVWRLLKLFIEHFAPKTSDSERKPE